MSAPAPQSITHIALDGLDSASAALAGERALALEALLAARGGFTVTDRPGPYALTLSVSEGRLVIVAAGAEGAHTFFLSLRPYRRLIQDYFLMINSYEKARRTATREKLEAIDMARRAVHNEGASLLAERLKGKIGMDHETARGFFTLVCALQGGHGRFTG